MMPGLASGVQQSPTIIEIRPYRGGGQCFEAAGNTVPVAPGSRALGLGGYRAHDHTAITLPPERPPTVKLDSVSRWIRESLFPLAVVTRAP